MRAVPRELVIASLSLGLLAVAFGWQRSVGLHPLNATVTTGLFGGVNNKCRQVQTTCPDLNGIPAQCSGHPTMPICYRCAMNVPNWSKCVTTEAAKNCNQSLPASNPYCGDRREGPRALGQVCGANDCPTNVGDCGQQIPDLSNYDDC